MTYYYGCISVSSVGGGPPILSSEFGNLGWSPQGTSNHIFSMTKLPCDWGIIGDGPVEAGVVMLEWHLHCIWDWWAGVVLFPPGGPAPENRHCSVARKSHSSSVWKTLPRPRKLCWLRLEVVSKSIRKEKNVSGLFSMHLILSWGVVFFHVHQINYYHGKKHSLALCCSLQKNAGRCQEV